MPRPTPDKPSRRRSRAQRTGKGAPTQTDLADALRAIEVRLDALDERLRSLEERDLARPVAGPVEIPCCCDDLVGCLDDCVDDVKELRKRVRDVRSPERGH